MRETYRFELTDDEYFMLGDSISNKLVDVYEDCKLHEGNPNQTIYEDFVKHFKAVKVLFEKVKRTSADRYLELYEEALADKTDYGKEVPF